MTDRRPKVGIVDLKTGEVYANAAEFMAEVRRRAALRDEHKTPPQDLFPREVPR